MKHQLKRLFGLARSELARGVPVLLPLAQAGGGIEGLTSNIWLWTQVLTGLVAAGAALVYMVGWLLKVFGVARPTKEEGMKLVEQMMHIAPFIALGSGALFLVVTAATAAIPQAKPEVFQPVAG